ncbi:MAG: aspartate-semialdehyde dehydrogenase [Deltaproteobacteria bacterium]|nr:aspartate-semialdehyde dehydrogenase [Deltaproteobacteria bacterium]
MKKYRVGVLGATGAVGQQFLNLLNGHPWFEVVAVAASSRSAGKKYLDATGWLLPGEPPRWLEDMVVQECTPGDELDFVFPGLDSTVAGEIEWRFAQNDIPVISNARNYRMNPLVPLLIPEVNPEHIQLIPAQKKKHGFRRGFLVTNPNCATVGLVLGLFPLWRSLGIEKIVVTTMQAISGAGYPGVPALDIEGNVLPFIPNEADKIQSEPGKILGQIVDGQLVHAKIRISAQCNRVPVRDGHLLSVSLKLKKRASRDEIVATYREFTSPLSEWNLPSAPLHPVVFVDEPLRPQPQRDAFRDGGMAVTVGQLSPCEVLDWRLVILVHNTIRGAAGGAILNAEWLHVNGLLR